MEKGIFPSAVYFLNDCRSQDWIRLKPEAGDSIIISHTGDRT